jgi:hypothetical protein
MSQVLMRCMSLYEETFLRNVVKVHYSMMQNGGLCEPRWTKIKSSNKFQCKCSVLDVT